MFAKKLSALFHSSLVATDETDTLELVKKKATTISPAQQQLNKQLYDAISNNDIILARQLLKQGAQAVQVEIPNSLNHPDIHDMSHTWHAAIQCSPRVITCLCGEFGIDFSNSMVRSTEALKHSDKSIGFDALVAAMQRFKNSIHDPNYGNLVKHFCFLFSMVSKKQLQEQPFYYNYSRDDYSTNNVTIKSMSYLHMAAWERNAAAFEALLKCGAQYDAKCWYRAHRKEQFRTAVELYPDFTMLVCKYAVLDVWKNKHCFCDVTVHCKVNQV